MVQESAKKMEGTKLPCCLSLDPFSCMLPQAESRPFIASVCPTDVEIVIPFPPPPPPGKQ